VAQRGDDHAEADPEPRTGGAALIHDDVEQLVRRAEARAVGDARVDVGLGPDRAGSSVVLDEFTTTRRSWPHDRI